MTRFPRDRPLKQCGHSSQRPAGRTPAAAAEGTCAQPRLNLVPHPPRRSLAEGDRARKPPLVNKPVNLRAPEPHHTLDVAQAKQGDTAHHRHVLEPELPARQWRAAAQRRQTARAYHDAPGEKRIEYVLVETANPSALVEACRSAETEPAAAVGAGARARTSYVDRPPSVGGSAERAPQQFAHLLTRTLRAGNCRTPCCPTSSSMRHTPTWGGSKRARMTRARSLDADAAQCRQ